MPWGDHGRLNLLAVSPFYPPKIGSYTGTTDVVHQNLDHLEKHNADKALILAGDHVYKMDYRKMLAFHEKIKADVTVGIIRVPIEQAHRFGIVAVDADGRIRNFVEKSRQSRARPE